MWHMGIFNVTHELSLKHVSWGSDQEINTFQVNYSLFFSSCFSDFSYCISLSDFVTFILDSALFSVLPRRMF